MALDPETLEMNFKGSAYGLSARRLWEHTELGQVNVFACSVNSLEGRKDPAAFIDLVRLHCRGFWLLGCTLSQWRAGASATASRAADCGPLPDFDQSAAVQDFVSAVADHLARLSMRLATRRQYIDFLPAAQAHDVFAQPFVFSTLRRQLRGLGKVKASPTQWERTVENFQKKGLRIDELRHSGLVPALLARNDRLEQITGDEVLSLCNFSAARLSVIPVVSDAQRQLRFAAASTPPLKRAKNLAKAQIGQKRAVVKVDPVLGYRLEKIEHQSLWGPETHWQAVAHDGRVVKFGQQQDLMDTAESAEKLAADDAGLRLPKRLALGRWSNLAWSGGKDYREWLVTLPYYPASYLSSHFAVLNVLAHIRCDVRDGAEGERVLMVQEIQSDWAKHLRGEVALLDADDPMHEQLPPFWKEWSALAMKLVLLHAAHQGFDAVAWTRGAHQVFRYKGLGARGLNQLYDQILPREVSRLVKPFGGVCEQLGVFVPANFGIRRTESGYEVYTTDGDVLGVAPTLEDTRQFVPDGGHELLYEVHGVRLTAASRQAMLAAGFPAWG